MTQIVKINVYPFEFKSALDQIHKWSRSWHWDEPPYSNPSFDIELEVTIDAHGLAQRHHGDRFNTEDPFWYRSDEEKAQILKESEDAQRLLDLLRERKVVIEDGINDVDRAAISAERAKATQRIREMIRKPKTVVEDDAEDSTSNLSASDHLMAHLKAKIKEQSNV